MVEKKYLKLGAAGLAVVALVVGLSVGITQSQKKNNVSAAAATGGAANQNANVALEDDCVYAKSGKSGKSGRRLVVPGTEDFAPARVSSPAQRQRRKLRNELQRGLQATDDGVGQPVVMEMEESAGAAAGDGGQGGAASLDDDDTSAALSDYDYSGKSGKSGSKSGKSGSGSNNVCRPRTQDTCATGSTYNTGKSGKSGNKSGKSGGGNGAAGKSGKSGNKSGKSGGGDCACLGNKSGKSGGGARAKSGKSGGADASADHESRDGDYDYDAASKSGKSGNKSGKSGGGGNGGCPCNPQPTLCPTPIPPSCDCDLLPFIFVQGVCARGCQEPMDEDMVEYATREECCAAAQPGQLCDVRDQCPPPTPEPTYSPITPAPTTCICEDLDIVFFDGQCRRECDQPMGPTYLSFRECCDAQFPGGPCQANDECPTDAPTDSPTVEVPAPTYSPTAEVVVPAPTYSPTAEVVVPAPTYSPTAEVPAPTYSPTGPVIPLATPAPTACVCEDQMWTYDGAQCIRGCGVEGSETYDNRARCCRRNFELFGSDCIVFDMCFPPPQTPEPTPSPTACVCEDQMWTYDGAQCIRGCGVEGSETYDNRARCCRRNFELFGSDCVVFDMCQDPTPPPSPQPTAGSTPTVSTEATGPPTRGARAGED